MHYKQVRQKLLIDYTATIFLSFLDFICTQVMIVLFQTEFRVSLGRRSFVSEAAQEQRDHHLKRHQQVVRELRKSDHLTEANISIGSFSHFCKRFTSPPGWRK